MCVFSVCSCIKGMCAFSVCSCIKRMCTSSIYLGFMDFSGLLWIFYKLVEILLILSSFKKKKSGSLFCTCTWLKFLPFRSINSSSIFSTLLASTCPSHETELDIYVFFIFFPQLTEPNQTKNGWFEPVLVRFRF
jgi:hypothetical protein